MNYFRFFFLALCCNFSSGCLGELPPPKNGPFDMVIDAVEHDGSQIETDGQMDDMMPDPIVDAVVERDQHAMIKDTSVDVQVPDMAADASPDMMIVDASPDALVDAEPDAHLPDATADMTPDATTDMMIVDASVDALVDAEPDAHLPDAQPDMAPTPDMMVIVDASPDSEVDMMPDMMGFGLPDMAPDGTPDMMVIVIPPDATPDMMIVDASVDALVDAEPDAQLPDATPDAMFDMMTPDAAPDAELDMMVTVDASPDSEVDMVVDAAPPLFVTELVAVSRREDIAPNFFWAFSVRYAVFGTSPQMHLEQTVRVVNNLDGDFTVAQHQDAVAEVQLQCRDPDGAGRTEFEAPLIDGVAEIDIDCWDETGDGLELEVRLKTARADMGADPGDQMRVAIDPTSLPLRAGDLQTVPTFTVQ